MEYAPLTPGRGALLAVAFYLWFLHRLWLGQVFRPAPDWSPRVDGVALGTAAYAALVVLARVVWL
ncbi:MAG: hypothetical protein M3P95_11785 [Actinomycetota bacterium]|nr:hypothetical protein [Actinomycetota bacterium]